MLTDIRASLAKGRRERVAAACTALFVAVVYALAVLTPAGQKLENAVFPMPSSGDVIATVSPGDPVPGNKAPAADPPEDLVSPRDRQARDADLPIIGILSSGHAAALGGLLLLVPLARRKMRLAIFHTLAVLAALRGRPSPADDTTTLCVRTPSGGMHVWYRAADSRRWQSSVGSSPGRALAWQVDIRAHGSYIIAPGTTTRHGTYTPVGHVRELAVLPLWLAQELERTGHLPASHIPAPRPVPPRARQAVLAAGGGPDRTQHLLAPVLAPVEACAQVAEGAGFSDALNRAAYTLGGLIAAGRLSQEEAERALKETAVAARPGQERRIEQIMRSGLAAGAKRPLYDSGRRT
ncbi:bifunctional DNA primase/polymerase [Streptomyces sp. NPDC057301]|uniref:bifunctional DNA primase/polymerase n=1 Tax=Streptomyces sp. NPDC057301 TaxID=3346093 RepID=UPI00363C1666